MQSKAINESEVTSNPLWIVQVSTGGIRIPPTGYGGIERVILNISKELSILKDVSVILIDRTFDAGDTRWSSIGNIQVRRVGSRFFGITNRLTSSRRSLRFIYDRVAELVYVIKVFPLLRKLIHNRQANAIHFHAPMTAFLLCHDPTISKRSLYTIHSVLHSPEYKPDYGYIERVYGYLDVWIGRHAAHLLTINPAQRSVFIKRYGISEDRVSLIVNGIDANRTQVRTIESVVNKFNIGERFTVLHVAKFSHQKGSDILIEAADILVNQRGDKDVLFLLVGKKGSEFTARLEDFITKRKLGDSVKFTGPLSNAELETLYSYSKIFALPSMADAFDIVVLEAMAFGKPIIGSNLSGMRIQVEDRMNGILLRNANPESVADAITYLKANKDLLQKMSTSSRERAKQFSWEQVASKLIPIYTSFK